MELKNFNGRLNKDMFTNIEKSMTPTELNLAYPNDKFLQFEESAIHSFIKRTVSDSKSGLTKAMGQDGEDILKKAEEELKTLKRVLIADENGERHIFVKAISLPKNEEIEKGVMTDTLLYDSKFTFKKTGKEIKEKLVIITAKLNAEVTALALKLDGMSEELPHLPTRKPSDYVFRGYAIDDCNYKMFEWNQCNFYDKVEQNGAGMSVESIQPASTQEEATCCRMWNDTVEKYFDTLVEVKSCEVLLENIADKSSYELTPRQIITFDFK
jgi:hypothetical protein